MAEKGKHSSAEQTGRKRHRLRLVVLAALAAMLVAALTSMEDGVHFASLRPWLMYGESASSQDVFSYAADTANQFGQLGGGLLVVGSGEIVLYAGGGAVYSVPMRMGSPQLSVGSKQAAVCDVGGGVLYLLDREGLRRELNTDRGLCYYSARLNSSDYLAVTRQKSGYKASVSVYNSGGKEIFHFDSSDNYISDAIVTEDCRRLAAVSLEAQNGAFVTRLLIYDLESAQLAGSSAIRDGLVLELASRKDRLIALCDKRLVISTLDGATLLDRPYGNLYLHDCALTGEDFCALLLGRYRTGNVCTLTTYGLDGAELASLELTEEVLDLSAAGDRLAVLFGDRLVIYDRTLTEQARLEDVGYAREVRMAADGTVLLLSGTSARRFLP